MLPRDKNSTKYAVLSAFNTQLLVPQAKLWLSRNGAADMTTDPTTNISPHIYTSLVLSFDTLPVRNTLPKQPPTQTPNQQPFVTNLLTVLYVKQPIN